MYCQIKQHIKFKILISPLLYNTISIILDHICGEEQNIFQLKKWFGLIKDRLIWSWSPVSWHGRTLEIKARKHKNGNVHRKIEHKNTRVKQRNEKLRKIVHRVVKGFGLAAAATTY